MSNDLNDYLDKVSQLIGEFFGILHNCRNDVFDRDYVLRENQKYKIIYRMSNSISIDLFSINYPNSGEAIIKNKMIVDQKGMRFESLMNYAIFGGNYELNRQNNSLQRKIEIIKNGYITFKVQPKIITIKISIVNEFKLSRDFIFIIEFLDSNDNNNNNAFYAYQYNQQRSPYGYPNPYGGFVPHGAFGNFAPHGFGFGH